MIPETWREWLRCLCRHDKKFSLRPQQEMAALVNHWDLQIIFSYTHPFCCIHDSVQHKHHSFYRTLRIVYNCFSCKKNRQNNLNYRYSLMQIEKKSILTWVGSILSSVMRWQDESWLGTREKLTTVIISSTNNSSSTRLHESSRAGTSLQDQQDKLECAEKYECLLKN